MNILEKFSTKILKWLIDSQERNRKKMILLLKSIEQQSKQRIEYYLLETYGNINKEKLDAMLYTEMRNICIYNLKDESFIEELDCYKNIIENINK